MEITSVAFQKWPPRTDRTSGAADKTATAAVTARLTWAGRWGSVRRGVTGWICINSYSCFPFSIGCDHGSQKRQTSYNEAPYFWPRCTDGKYWPHNYLGWTSVDDISYRSASCSRLQHHSEASSCSLSDNQSRPHTILDFPTQGVGYELHRSATKITFCSIIPSHKFFLVSPDNS